MKKVGGGSEPGSGRNTNPAEGKPQLPLQPVREQNREKFGFGWIRAGMKLAELRRFKSGLFTLLTGTDKRGLKASLSAFKVTYFIWWPL